MEIEARDENFCDENFRKKNIEKIYLKTYQKFKRINQKFYECKKVFVWQAAS